MALDNVKNAILKAKVNGEVKEIWAKTGAENVIVDAANNVTLATKLTNIDTTIGEVPSKVGEVSTANVVAYVDAKVAAASSSADEAIEALDATVRGNLTDADAIVEGKKVGVKIVEEDGKLTGVTVVENDIASAALLGGKTDAKTAETAFGYIAKEADRATTAEGALSDKIGTIPAKVGETATTNVVDYVDAKVAAAAKTADDAVKALDATVESDDATLVKVKVVEEDGKITDVVVTDLDTTVRADITALQALHAEGKTVAEEAADAVSAVVADAPEAFDTLKEIASWIQKEEGKEGFDAANRITTLETKVGNEATTGENATAATGLIKDVRDLQAAVGAGGSVATQIKEAVEALDATVADKLNAAKDALAEGEKVGVKIVEEDGKLTGVTVFTNDIASAALVGAKTDAKTADTVFGAIAKVADDLATEVSTREAYVAPAAKKLVDAQAADIAVGDVNTPVYFVNGLPVASTFTIKTSVPENAVFTDTTYTAVAATEGADAGLMTSADKIKLDTIINGATKVEASETNGNIKINGVETNVYTHPTTSGNKHIPSGGTTGQYLKYSADGTASWADLIRTGSEVPADLAAGELFIQLV